MKRKWFITAVLFALIGCTTINATAYAGPRLDFPAELKNTNFPCYKYTGNYPNYATTETDYTSPVSQVQFLWTADMVKDKSISKREEGLEIKGVVPEMTETLGTPHTAVNEAINVIVAAKITAAKDLRAKSISFSYMVYHSDDLISVVLYDTVKSASKKEGVASVNFRPVTGEIVGLNEAVGLNVIPLAEKILIEKIRRNPDQYNASFDTLPADQPFYMTNNRIVLLFNEFQLTTVAEGFSTLEMDLQLIDYVVVNNKSAGYYTKPGYYNLKMVPLRQVCEGLGYKVEWYPGEQRVDLYRDGTLVIELSIAVNNYQVREKQRSLEAAPELVQNNVYVPISFFDQILSLVTYSVDDRENITFISYQSID